MGEPRGNITVPLAYNSNGRLRSLESDANDHLLIKDGMFEEANYKAERFTNTSATAGTNIFTSEVVPTGKLLRVNIGFSLNGGHINTFQYLTVYDGTYDYLFNVSVSPPAGQFTAWNGTLDVWEGLYIRIMFLGTTAGDSLVAGYYGLLLNL